MSKALSLFLLLLVSAAFAGLSIAVLNQPPSFDGAFHLQAVRTLLENGDLALTYDGYHRFDYSIQMGLPFLGAIALAFLGFGESFAAAQATTLVYFALLLTTAFFLTRRLAGAAPALFGILLACTIPAIENFALPVFGEIAGLFWFMLGCLVLSNYSHTRRKSHSVRAGLVAGLCFGLAILTKIVLMLSIPALLVTGLLVILVRQYRDFGVILAALLGILPVLLAFEVYRMLNLGWAEFLAYWHLQLALIANKGGGGGFDYLKVHDSFASAVRHGLWPGVWLGAVAATAVSALLWTLRADKGAGPGYSVYGRKPFLQIADLGICVAVILALGYACWWFAILPDPFYRRLINPLLLLSFLLPPLLAWCWRRGIRFGKPWAALGFVLCLSMLANGIVWRDWQWKPEPVQYPVVDYIQTQQGEAAIGTWGWWQAPRISFLLRQSFVNLLNPASRNTLQSGRDLIIVHRQQKQLDPASYEQMQPFLGERLYHDEYGYEVYRYQEPDGSALLRQALSSSGAKPVASITFPLDPELHPQLGLGFYAPEPSGVWAQPKAILTLPVPDTPAELRIKMWIDGRSLGDSAEAVEGRITVNGHEVHRLYLEGKLYELSIPLSQAEITGDGNFLEIGFDIPASFRPIDLGISGDTRVLSFRLISAELMPALAGNP